MSHPEDGSQVRPDVDNHDEGTQVDATPDPPIDGVAQVEDGN